MAFNLDHIKKSSTKYIKVAGKYKIIKATARLFLSVFHGFHSCSSSGFTHFVPQKPTSNNNNYKSKNSNHNKKNKKPCECTRVRVSGAEQPREGPARSWYKNPLGKWRWRLDWRKQQQERAGGARAGVGAAEESEAEQSLGRQVCWFAQWLHFWFPLPVSLSFCFSPFHSFLNSISLCFMF